MKCVAENPQRKGMMHPVLLSSTCTLRLSGSRVIPVFCTYKCGLIKKSECTQISNTNFSLASMLHRCTAKQVYKSATQQQLMSISKAGNKKLFAINYSSAFSLPNLPA